MRFVASPSSHTIKKAMLRLSALWALKLANNCGSCVLLAWRRLLPGIYATYNDAYPGDQADAAKDTRQCHADGRRGVVRDRLHGGHGDDRAHDAVGPSGFKFLACKRQRGQERPVDESAQGCRRLESPREEVMKAVEKRGEGCELCGRTRQSVILSWRGRNSLSSAVIGKRLAHIGQLRLPSASTLVSVRACGGESCAQFA